MAIKSITQERLKELLTYYPDTGLFIRNKSTGGINGKAGDIAGSVTQDGYIASSIDRKCMFHHRLAFLYIEGSLPPNHVDHINRIRYDNRWDNLRHATIQLNQHNTKRRSNNKSGVTGVHWLNKRGRWSAMIRINGKNTCVYCGLSFLDACCARKSAEVSLDYHPNHGR